jgi:DNA polymerase III subunit epsilon
MILRAAWRYVGAITLILGIAIGVMVLRPGLEKLSPALVVLLAIFCGLVLLVAGYLIGRAVGRIYRVLLERWAEETRIIVDSNPANRLKASDLPGSNELMDAINALAARYQSLQADVEAKVEAAGIAAKQEKERLAAIINQLTQAVVVCAADGRILLYNSRSQQLLEPGSGGGAGLLGIGRSIYPLLDRNVLAHGLEAIRRRQQERFTRKPASSFMAAVRTGQLIRVEMGAIVPPQSMQTPEDSLPDIFGFVLTLHDVTRPMESARHSEAVVQAISAAGRKSLANIRAAVEAILSFPDIPAEQRDKFLRIINEEASALGDELTGREAEYASLASSQWSIEEIRIDDLLSAIQRRIEQKLGVRLHLKSSLQPVWLRVDSYALVQCVTYLASRLSYEFAVKELTLRVNQEGRFLCLDIECPGTPITIETWNSWENQPLRMGGEASSMSLRLILERHGGEAWYHTDPASRIYLRLLVPPAPHEPSATTHVTASHVLGYVDSDLPASWETTGDFENRSLADLIATAIFLATTGPNASAGDEIFAIGAIRIVGNRLVENEVFERLINPRAPVPPSATAAIGIEPAALKTQPSIDQVLPDFWRFCRGTVLVSCNAQLALGFLRAREIRFGASFDQPILDPLRLYAICYPMSAPAGLLDLADRHAIHLERNAGALARAIATGQVYVKITPALAARGIDKLKAAKEATEISHHIRSRQ